MTRRLDIDALRGLMLVLMTFTHLPTRFASPVGQTCEGGFVRVAPFQRSCQEVAGTLPKVSLPADNLSNPMLFNLANNGGQALLVPTGNTCIVVSVARMGG